MQPTVDPYWNGLATGINVTLASCYYVWSDGRPFLPAQSCDVIGIFLVPAE